MKIGLIDVDGHNYPNLPLMKISAFHKQKGDEVRWYDAFDGLVEEYDRDYQIGDTVIFREYDGKDFTGRYTQQVRIEYILRDCPEYGLMDGYCIFGFRG